STQLFGEPVVQGGAGWDNIWSVALGGRYKITECLSVQAGYLFNENPVPSQLALFNTQLPALTQHTVSAGAYYQLNESIGVSMAYIHGFKNSITGAIFPVGTSTTLDSEYDSLAFGIHIKFGGSRCSAPCEPSACCSSSPADESPPAAAQPAYPTGSYPVR
ncbi:MAG: outer membrane protein transport protein, partial [Thermomicrobiales bacterium]